MFNGNVVIPSILPFFLGFIAVVTTIVYAYVAMTTPLEFGRVSSTYAIGYLVFLPLITISVAGAGLLGYALKSLFHRYKISIVTPKAVCIVFLLIATSATSTIAGYAAYSGAIESELRNTPKVVSTHNGIKRLPYGIKDTLILSTPSLVLESINNDFGTVNWSDRSLKVSIDEYKTINLYEKKTNRKALDLSGYAYINSVSVLTFENYLAVVVELRATSARTMLYILDKNYDIVHQELLERYGLNHTISAYETDSSADILLDFYTPFRLSIPNNL